MTDQASRSLDTLLTRNQVAAALTAAGFPISAATLSTKVTRPGPDGGPPYRAFGPRVLYRWGDALAWAEARLIAPQRRGTITHTAQHAA